MELSITKIVSFQNKTATLCIICYTGDLPPFSRNREKAATAMDTAAHLPSVLINLCQGLLTKKVLRLKKGAVQYGYRKLQEDF
jgi:hypothetical protein